MNTLQYAIQTTQCRRSTISWALQLHDYCSGKKLIDKRTWYQKWVESHHAVERRQYRRDQYGCLPPNGTKPLCKLLRVWKSVLMNVNLFSTRWCYQVAWAVINWQDDCCQWSTLVPQQSLFRFHCACFKTPTTYWQTRQYISHMNTCKHTAHMCCML